jgi:protoporphyrinogen oxidase
MRIGIIGGGLMGMALAHRLTVLGHEVTVFERDPQIGGLATHHDYGGFYWDRFYHVVLPTDRHLIAYIKEIGLGDQLEWRRTLTGFYVNDRMYSISNSLEFLRFPLLTLHAKLRLAWTMYYAARIDDWRRLERISVTDWLTRVSGRQAYEKLWQPLLLAKLGRNYERVSAVFIWSYIKRLFSARDGSAGKEQLGHVRGGYRSIFEHIQQRIEGGGGRVVRGADVAAVEPSAGGKLSVRVGGEPQHFDKVVCTSPVSVLRRLVNQSLLRVEREGDVEYLGVLCVVVVSNAPILPFYVVNIADERVPFTAIIGMSNVVAPKNTAGRYLTYLPKYLLSTDPGLERDADAVRSEFLAGLQRILPKIDLTTIESVHVNRARRVQPLQVLRYSQLVPKIDTAHPHLFVLNTAQFVDATLNNNEVIRAVNRFCDSHREQLAV